MKNFEQRNSICSCNDQDKCCCYAKWATVPLCRTVDGVNVEGLITKISKKKIQQFCSKMDPSTRKATLCSVIVSCADYRRKRGIHVSNNEISCAYVSEKFAIDLEMELFGFSLRAIGE